MTHRVSNFNAGPAGLPLPALKRAADELLDYAGTGMSIMEHSHRGKAYEAVHNEAITLLRELLGLGDDRVVLFMQGGASQQFATLPMNFLAAGRSADYLMTGHWSERALDEATKVTALLGGAVRVAASSKDGKTYRRLPKASEIELDSKAAYVHMTSNNTIFGTQWFGEPAVGQVPLVADMSSDFLWRKHDVSKYAMIYAGAQKNVGPSGVCVVIMHKDFLAKARTDLPTIFRYATFAEQNSLYNTPPTFGIYLMRNVLSWIKSVGGLGQIEAWNRQKGALLYAAIDAAPDYYTCPVEPAARSLMNIVFRLPNEALEDTFVKQAEKAGLVGLKGHRSVGGIRVSAYNAVSVADIEKLVAFMRDFAAKNRP
jgi:phosphoserine aminotransferase